jgi:2-polyprenyl-6-methoxyphenol hydroxylase-like FAD-dependent oxidoreductase
MSKGRTRVVIIGAGPAGLVLALELGRRNVPCIVFEQNQGPPDFPKANATTSRTMEHFRRLGMVEEIRALGLPDDYAPDITYHTRFSRYELARLHWPSRAEALRARHRDDTHWPTPEPVHRAQQMLIEPVLRRHVERYPSVDLRLGWRVEAATQDAESVRVRANDVASGESIELIADYAVGCDGPRSVVREALGIRYAGTGSEDREFMGGRMLAAHLDAPQFYQSTGTQASWQHWAINRERFAVMAAIDGRGRFIFHTQLPSGQSGSLDYARESIALATGCSFPYEILGIAEWTAGFTLVAERYGAGRMFLAGDAAHLFTPTAGLGYNTSVDDAANLGWKLAAVCQGWGGPALLSTYEIERRPIAERNTRFARSVAEVFRNLGLTPAFEDDSAEGAEARAAVGERLYRSAAREFEAPGIHLGMFYHGSPVIAEEPGDPPPDEPNRYLPQARPGARAPHLWLGEGEALYDRLGSEFTLLKLSAGLDTRALEQAAQARGLPLTVLELARDDVRTLYGSDLVLIRPDQHVAWRGNAVPPGPDALLARVTGAVMPSLVSAAKSD